MNNGTKMIKRGHYTEKELETFVIGFMTSRGYKLRDENERIKNV